MPITEILEKNAKLYGNEIALIEINPEDAAELGISDGQWVEIFNQFGDARLKAKVSPIVKKGQLLAQHGWWFPEQDAAAPNLNGVWQSNVNCLLPAGYNSKLGYGAPFKCNMCGLRPLKESYDTDMSLVAEKFGKLA